MSNKKELIIHLGYPKTASTYLQNNVFPYCENYLNITEKKLFDEIFFSLNSLSEKILKKKFQIFRSKIEQINYKKKNILSEELLSSNFTRNFYTPEYKLNYLYNLFSGINLKISFILINRNYKEHLRSIFIESNYHLLHFDKKNLSLEYFLKSTLDKKSNLEISNNLNILKFKKFLKKIFKYSKVYLIDMDDIFTKKKIHTSFLTIVELDKKKFSKIFEKKPLNKSIKVKGFWNVKTQKIFNILFKYSFKYLATLDYFVIKNSIYRFYLYCKFRLFFYFRKKNFNVSKTG